MRLNRHPHQDTILIYFVSHVINLREHRGYSMKRLSSIILALLFYMRVCAQTQDGCVRQEIFDDSITRTYFCSNFNYDRNEFWEVRFFSGFDHKDSFKLADIEFGSIYEIERELPNQLITLNKDKLGQRSCLDIESNLQKYHRQYFSYIDRNGDKIILINFLFFHNKNEIPNLNRPAFYTDGGSRFWKIKYNIRTKTFFDLKVNGQG